MEELRTLTEKQVSETTGISLAKLRNDRSRGVGCPYVKYGRSVRYLASDVKTFLQAQRILTESTRTVGRKKSHGGD